MIHIFEELFISNFDFANNHILSANMNTQTKSSCSEKIEKVKILFLQTKLDDMSITLYVILLVETYNLLLEVEALYLVIIYVQSIFIIRGKNMIFTNISN